MEILHASGKALHSAAAGSPPSSGFAVLFVGSAVPQHKSQPPEPPPNSTKEQPRELDLGLSPPCCLEMRLA